MSRPSMPLSVIDGNGRTHLTKAQKTQRKQGEEALASGTALKERSEVKHNETAHKEFTRINKLLKNIQKNDALYETIINRYCMILYECVDLETKREEFQELVRELRKEFKETVNYIQDEKDRALLMIEFTREIAKITNSILCIDGAVQQKRKMLLDIEKENIMTIASALRSIPKKVEDKEEEDPMAIALRRRRG